MVYVISSTVFSIVVLFCTLLVHLLPCWHPWFLTYCSCVCCSCMFYG